MFGALIGLFITSAGIVVGADSVLWGSHTQGTTRVGKTCVAGPRSVAAFEGWYGEELYLYKQFLEACRALQQSPKPLSPDDQSEQLIGKLQRAYRDRTGALPVNASSVPDPSSRHVAFVTVAGFEGEVPLVSVRELRWDNTRKGAWRLVAERVGKLSFRGCGVKFLGEIGVAGLLLDTSPHFEQEKRRPEVRAAGRANNLHKEDHCFLSTFTVHEAKELYKTAVRLTIDHAEQYSIQHGPWGGGCICSRSHRWVPSRTN